MTRPYEVLLILKTVGTEAELNQAVRQLEEPIKRAGGQIANSASWGRRRLAYRISRNAEGHYQLIQFALDPAQLEDVKRAYRLNEAIVRFLVLNRVDAPPPAAPVPVAAAAA